MASGFRRIKNSPLDGEFSFSYFDTSHRLLCYPSLVSAVGGAPKVGVLFGGGGSVGGLGVNVAVGGPGVNVFVGGSVGAGVSDGRGVFVGPWVGTGVGDGLLTGVMCPVG